MQNLRLNDVNTFRSTLDDLIKPFREVPAFEKKREEIGRLIQASEDHVRVIFEVTPDALIRDASVASVLANTYTLVGVCVGYWQAKQRAA